ncbi:MULTISPECIES: GntR family transcriptional regulator [Clostridium]|uniref:GntR family transcriptional regulator n=1 Tax=Clostridium TaxID=1485 RepID=UPI0018978E1A|nr:MULTISPECIES: GntR family transcriptional regulator [Clostridium]MCR1950328.1 GntR family transcriptional regulator [Clostridium sp. DSM 100503]MDI9218082.1 GntR family transcriptional regulator [Clostridium tertium]
MHISEKLPQETSREYAYRVILNNIISLDLKPGTMVSENELSSQLGLSRTPVREAMIELFRIKLVEILPQRGSKVSLVDYNLVEEANFMRLALETAIVEYACNNCKSINFEKLDENLNLQKFYMNQNNPEKLLELDNSFHKELFNLCNKSQCYNLMKSMSAHFDRVRNMSAYMLKDTNTYEEHVQLLNAIKNSNKDKALEIIKSHLEKFRIHEIELKKLHPEYFVNTPI